MSGHKQETVFDLGMLFQQINRSFTDAALELHKAFDSEEWSDQPYVYRMPRMHLSISLELSHSDGSVKGVFRKRSTETSELLTSRIEVDVVSVPRSPGAATGSTTGEIPAGG